MKDELISFETAKLAKEKGFNIECLHFYTKPQSKMFGIDEHGRSYLIKNKSKSLYVIGEHATLNIESAFYAPTQSLLQKWLREEHQICIDIITNVNAKEFIFFVAISWVKDEQYNSIYLIEEDQPLIPMTAYTIFNTYEEALEAGLQEALKLIELC